MAKQEYTISKALRGLDEIEKKLPSALRSPSAYTNGNPYVRARMSAYMQGNQAAGMKAAAVRSQRASGATFDAAAKTKNPVKRFRLNRTAAAQTDSAGRRYAGFARNRDAGRAMRAQSRGLV
jgi:hypothetical protein